MTETFDYAASRDDADELLAEFGQAVSLRRVTASGPAREPTLTPADYATIAAIVDYSDRQVNGESILATDRRAIVAAGPLTALGITSITPADKLVVGGVVVPIVRVMPLNPAGVTVMYDCQLRF